MSRGFSSPDTISIEVERSDDGYPRRPNPLTPNFGHGTHGFPPGWTPHSPHPGYRPGPHPSDFVPSPFVPPPPHHPHIQSGWGFPCPAPGPGPVPGPFGVPVWGAPCPHPHPAPGFQQHGWHHPHAHPSPGFQQHAWHHPHHSHQPAHPTGQWPRHNRQGRRRQPIIDVDLQVRPENMYFPTCNAMHQHLISVYRPQVGVIANIVKNMLRLSERPHVHLGLPPVHVGASTGGEPLLMPGVTTSRGPVFQITVPPRCIHDPGSLQRVVNVLKDELVANMNPWYRHAGFMFRTSRNTQMHRRRYWVPPSLVYCWDHAMQSYTARYVEPPRGDIREVLGADGVGDTTEDDQADLVDEMWDDVRQASYFRRAQQEYEYMFR